MSWELTVIGTALADPQTMQEAEELLPTDFTGANCSVWAEMLALHSRGALDARALTEALRTSGVGNPERIIAEALNYRGTTMSEYARQVLDASIKRSVKRSAMLITAEADDDTKTADELLDYAETAILRLRRTRAEGVTMADLIGVFIPRLNGMLDGSHRPAWIPKVQALKDIIHYGEDSELIIVAARPGEGKSSFIRYEAKAHSETRGPVAIFNYENDQLEYPRAFIALDTGIDSTKLKNPRLLNDVERDMVRRSAEKVSRMPITILSSFGDANWISRSARKLISEGCSLICVDYIQLVNNANTRKVDDIGVTTRTLRSIALQHGVPVMAASQLSRNIETRGGDPVLSDLRDSGTIEQDATMVIFPRGTWTAPSPQQIAIFPENVDPQTGRILPDIKAIPIRFHVCKNRNGPTGTSSIVKWIKSTGHFHTLDRSVQI